MKKLFLIVPCLVLLTLLAEAKIVEKTYTFNRYTVSRSGNFDIIQFEGLTLSGIAGEPTLPWQSVQLALAPGEVVDRIEVITGKLVDIPGTFHLYPMQFSQPLSKGTSGAFVIKNDVYQSSDAYPSSRYGQVTTAFLKGVSIGMTTITPLLYIPRDGKVKYYASLRVKFYTKSSVKAQDALQNMGSGQQNIQRLQQYVQNPSTIGKYPEKKLSASDYQVLIITGSSYVSTFQPLVNLYLRRGLRSQVADVNTINTTVSGQDLQEKIRTFIKQEYQAHGIDYVVLGGDVEIVPARGFYCHVQSSSVYEDWNIPSDLYYSALDGTWDDNGNHVWGEIGEDDLLPEVAVGRIPFSSQQEATTMINKSISYQNTPVVQELNRVLLLGEKLADEPLTWGGDYLDLLIGHKTDNGYTTDGIYTTADIEKMYDRDLPQPWDVDQLLTSLNEGKPFVHHSGHASSSYNMRMFSWDINENAFSGLNGTEHNFCIIYSHGCYSGSFDDEDCIAEEMLKLNHFAVEYVGNSRYGWFNEGTTEGPSEHLNREFVNALYHNEDYRIGETHRQSRLNSASWVTAPGQWEEGALRWCFYCCNVLGDPVLGIWTDIPVNMQINCPTSVPAYSTQMTVSVQDNIGAVEGVTCAFVSGNILYGAAVTDNTGTATIQFDIIPQNPGNAEVVVSGYNRLGTAIPVNIGGTVGINPQSQDKEVISISPNPCHENISVTIITDEPESLAISIFSMDGRLLNKVQHKNITPGQNILNIDELVRTISAGVYYVKVDNGTHINTVKLIKN